MTPRLQSKLLRVLQEKQYTPVGSNTVKNIDVRIIAATNKDLEGAVKANEFRLDLYYRLNVLPIKLPTLSERKGDIELLLEHFCEQMNRIHLPDPPCWFDPTAIEVLGQYQWPGNVRQLQNLVERLVITHTGGRIGIDDLPKEFVEVPTHQTPSLAASQGSEDMHSPKRQGAISKLPLEGMHLDRYIEELENELIRQALDRTHNNKSQASKLLGMNRTTLVEKLKKRQFSPNSD